MHWFKRNIGDYHKKAGRLTMLQHGAYTLLMDSCYDREQFPTKEEAIEWVWASTPEEIQAVEFVLSRFFTLEDGVYTQHRIKEEIENYQSKAENNKRIALEREAKRRDKRTKQHETCTDGSRDVNESPPNQEPITNNQEPITNNQELETKERESATATRTKKFVKPTIEEIYSYMQERDYDSRDEAENFYDYWESAGWSRKNGKIKDWRATVRTWLKNAKPISTGEPEFVLDKCFRGIICYSTIKEIFNESLTNANPIAKLTDKRKQLVKKLFDEFALDYDKFKSYLEYMNDHPDCQWMFEKRPKNDGSGQNWNACKFEYFVSEKCFLNVKENL